MNVMSMIVFAPAAIVLSLEILFTVTGDLEQYSFIFSQMVTTCIILHRRFVVLLGLLR